MPIAIQIPTPLRQYTDDEAEVVVEGATVGEVMSSLVNRHSGLKPHLYTEQGELRSFVNLFLNDEDVRYLERENTAVQQGDQLAIIPSIAGGRFLS